MIDPSLRVVRDWVGARNIIAGGVALAGLALKGEAVDGDAIGADTAGEVPSRCLERIAPREVLITRGEAGMAAECDYAMADEELKKKGYGSYTIR